VRPARDCLRSRLGQMRRNARRAVPRCVRRRRRAPTGTPGSTRTW
jgi:hypothetical protein